MEKHLKAKGIRKTLSTLNRITRGPLHRAKVALENHDSEDLIITGREFPLHLQERFSDCQNFQKMTKSWSTMAAGANNSWYFVYQ